MNHYKMFINTALPISIVFLVISCERNYSSNEQMPSLYESPISNPVDTVNGYEINPLTGERIPSVISTQNSLKTYKSNGKKIDQNNYSAPIVVTAGKPRFVSARPNTFRLSGDRTFKVVSPDSLTIKKVRKNKASSFIINAKGDTIKTGISTELTGTQSSCLSPDIVEAKPLKMKSNAVADIQYMIGEQGLSSSNIQIIISDRKGRLWIGTNDAGLTCFDGQTFTNYSKAHGLISNDVRTLLEDQSGNIWIGTDGGGLSCYNGECFVHYTENEGLGSNDIRSLAQDRDGNIWIGTMGAGVCRFNGKNIVHYTVNEGLSANDVVSILEDRKGNLWFGTLKGGVSHFNGHCFTHYTQKTGLSSNDILSIAEDRFGNLWFGTGGGGVNFFDGEKFTSYSEKNGLSSNYITSIKMDRSGDLWFGTDGNGVNSFNGAYFTHYSKNEGLTSNYIQSIAEDKNGNIWLGTFGAGVIRIDKRGFTNFSKKQGVVSNSIQQIVEDNEGNIWFGTLGEGAYCYKNDSLFNYTVEDGLISNLIRSVYADSKGNIWFGADGYGLSRFDGEVFTHFTKNQGLTSNYIKSITEDLEGNIWFGTWGGGVCRYDGENIVQFTENEGLSSNDVTTVTVDQKGRVWIGTLGGGINRFDGKHFWYLTEKQGLSSNYITSIFEDYKGNIWIGTDGFGLNCFNGESITYYSEKNGLCSNYIQSLVEDQNHQIWIGTEKGLSSIGCSKFPVSNDSTTIKQSHTVIWSFDNNDGLLGTYFYTNSALVDGNNQLWWGSDKGLQMLDMDRFRFEDNPPIVQIQDVEIMDRTCDYHNPDKIKSQGFTFTHADKYFNCPEGLELESGYNDLTFHYSAIDWSSPHKILYSYKIKGINKNWSKPTNSKKAVFKDLPSGSFVFQLCAIGESGQWSRPVEYAFTIHPPWWNNVWSRTTYGISTILLLLGIQRRRNVKFRNRQMELEKKVDDATEEIRHQKLLVEQQKEAVEVQKEVIEEAHKAITDSIAHAKKIQSAILPTQKLFDRYLKDYFILYKPKNVVAGDFYWLEHIDDKVLFAAADCTGHGVPGALVSVICNSGLNRSVREFGLSEPGRILDKTREIVIREFEKSEDEVMDGMDIALCCIKGNEISYAGAHNPLWIIRKNNNVDETDFPSDTRIETISGYTFIEVKPDKQPIGKFDTPKPYKTHKLKLQPDDAVYVFTDGYADQFGGVEAGDILRDQERGHFGGKKFKKRALKELLLSIQDYPMDEQKQLIDGVFEAWRGELEQIDDVCVIGVRI